jgi:hypothetical protein
MKDDINNLDHLSKEELELKKLRMEIRLLQPQVDDIKKIKLPTKIFNYVQKNLTQISGIIILIVGIVAPFWGYIDNERKSELVKVNNSILQLVDPKWSDPEKTDSLQKKKSDSLQKKILEVSLDDPKIVAPFLLGQLNDLDESNININIVNNVFERMYTLNKQKVNRSFSDRIIFIFFDDNKEILEDELWSNANSEFNLPFKNDSENADSLKVNGNLRIIWNTYLTLIKKLALDKNKRFIKLTDQLWSNCNSSKKNKDLLSNVIYSLKTDFKYK